MELDYENTIISESTCGCSTIHTVAAHHRRYPEIAVEAITAARAVEHLERLLLRALDYEAEQWRREALQQAIVDVRRCERSLAAASNPSLRRRQDPQGCPPPRAD